ncbi:MAG: long-chain fatty acid--CoA ligase [Rhodococcus sp. (in: high G+C Gram-positive bacteria)]
MREFTSPAVFVVENSESAVDTVFTRASNAPNSVAFRRLVNGSWSDVTAASFAAEVVKVAKGLIAAGVRQGDRVALMSSTRYEWSIIDYAIWASGGVTVPVYETSSAGQVEWILSDADPVLLVLETDRHVADTADVVAAHFQRSTGSAHTFRIDGDTLDSGAIAELTALGADTSDDEVHARVAALRSSDPATLIYTSGTTGRPKGVQLTHANLLAESRGIRETSLNALLRPGSRTLMFLPLAHVLARAVTIAAFDAGTAVGHTNDIPNLVATFGTFAPDFILSVPRVFEKVYNTAKQKAHSDGKGKIFDAAADTAVAWSEAQDGRVGAVLRIKHAVFDKLVYAKLRAALGGQCQLAISGGAPLGARLGHFYRGIGVPIYEGYGLTETSAAFAVNTIGNQRVGSVGRPLPGNTVRIAQDDEIQLRGPVVFSGYWRNEEATAESLDDGWFRTGDLGSVDEDGYITITGRKKELIVTAGGKNVSPAGLEDQLRAHALISQAIVVGDQKPFIGALVTLDDDALSGWKAAHGKPAYATAADLAKDVDLIAEIDAAVAETNKSVSHAEAIKKYRILPGDFIEESGEMTPTMKLKRNVIVKSYADEIEAIYAR